MGYSPWDRKELDMTEMSWHTCTNEPTTKLHKDIKELF